MGREWRACLGFMSCVLAGVLISGCEQQKDTQPDDGDVALPSYAELAAAHNARVKPIAQYRARAVVEFEWYDEDGKKHFEQGDGPMRYRPPDQLALKISKADVDLYWLGCDAKRYWLFDLHAKPRTGWVGSHAKAVGQRRANAPLPIRPDQIVGLLGFGPLDANAEATVAAHKNGYLIEYPPDKGRDDQALELVIKPGYGVQSVRITDKRGDVVLTAELSQFNRMEIEGLPPGGWPWVAEKVHIELPMDRTTVDLFAREPWDGGDSVKDVHFDYDKLVKALKIDPAQIEDLDPRADRP